MGFYQGNSFLSQDVDLFHSSTVGIHRNPKTKPMKRTSRILTLAMALSTSIALAKPPPPPLKGGPPPPDQNQNPPPDQPPGDDKGRPHPKPPLLEALDLNKDGIISASEIAKAPESLKKLDKNGDGQITPDELRPPAPPQKGPPGKGPKKPKPDKAPHGNAPPADAPQPPPDKDNAEAPPADMPDGPAHRHPPSPLMEALDTNGDGILSADEIANASESLKKLDKNGDGKLTPDEYRPAPPKDGGKPPKDDKDPAPPAGKKPAPAN